MRLLNIRRKKCIYYCISILSFAFVVIESNFWITISYFKYDIGLERNVAKLKKPIKYTLAGRKCFGSSRVPVFSANKRAVRGAPHDQPGPLEPLANTPALYHYYDT